MNKKNEGEEYLKKFPKLNKWINECICCHNKGYNPNIPDQISKEGSLSVYYIKKYFKPLKINEEHLCENCEKLLKNK